jgi:UDP-N-acetylglucosamine 2-epimerase (non-hydrolysing)
MKNVLIVFGTRPEAIKMVPVVREFKKHGESFNTAVCVTGQHREMLDQVLNFFEIEPDFDLNIMKAGQDLHDITSRVILGMRDVLEKFNPDVVLVHGDTTTSCITALSAFYKQIPVAHVEAGLRTNNIYSPWPEEVNRQLTARIATFNFPPTELSKQNLLRENVEEEKICVTGNTVIDVLHLVLEKIDKDKKMQKEMNREIKLLLGTSFNFGIDRFILITGHRRENFGKGFLDICEAIKILAKKYSNVHFVYPVHLNPNVQRPVYELLGYLNNIHLIDPQEYLNFVFLMSKSYLVLTDSGGIQEEAPGLGKPVLVMRDSTERPEAVEAGTVKLVGTNKKLIVDEISKLLEDQDYFNKMAKANNPYGDGNASKRIVTHLLNNL